MSRIYKGIIGICDKVVPTFLRPLWDHPAGPKTVFFWAPTFKWGLVLAGIGDITRPADKISMPQVLSLAVTGLIWSRYSVVIIPVNYNLLSVNMFVCALVAASLEDYRRPLDKVSTTQSATLAATGLVWTRYCLVIRPINYSLSLCNLMLGCANGFQCIRAYRFQRALQMKQ